MAEVTEGVPKESSARYRFTTEVPIRFRDLDALGHVNHAAYLTLLEQARVVYFSKVLKRDMPDDLKSWVLAEISCKYRLALGMNDQISIAVRTEWMRNSSFGCAYEIRTMPDQAVAASGTFVQVHVSVETGRAQPLDEALRARVAAYESIARFSK